MSPTPDRAVSPATADPSTSPVDASRQAPSSLHWSTVDLPPSVLLSDPRIKAVGTLECGEPLVDVRRFRRVVVDERHAHPSGSWALVRVGVLDRLLRAADALPSGLRLVLVEGYRSVARQRDYFDRYVTSVQATSPALDEDAARMQAGAFVSPPDTAPHCSGAAVDVTLVDAAGDEMDMGTAVGASTLGSRDCFTAAPHLPERAQRNRALLHAAMEQAGFVNYPTEWWHFSYGDRYWAFCTDRAAALYDTIASPWGS